MRAFTIAVLGAPDSGQGLLREALANALKLATRPVSVVLANPATSTYCDLVLLMGLLHPQSPAMAASDQLIRLALARTGTAYDVLYGNQQEQLVQALGLLEKKLGKPSTAHLHQELQVEPKQKPWAWLCDTCSDPQCEHQLLTQLLAQRATAP